MKRKMAGCLLALLLALLLPKAARAAEAPNVSVQSAAAEAGETVTIAVVLSGNTGFADLSLAVDFDQRAMQLIAVHANEQTGAIFTGVQELQQSPCVLNWVEGTRNNAFNGTLAAMEFRLNSTAAGEYPITISYYKGINGDYIDGTDVNFDEQFKPLRLTYTSGKITAVPEQTKIMVSVGAHTAILSADHACSGQIYVASYRSDGRLCAAKAYPAAASIQAEAAGEAAYTKIMWVDGNRPVCAAKTIPQ